MSLEAGVLIDNHGNPFYWHCPDNRTSIDLPDSQNLWDAIWDNKNILLGFAHSHPGCGDLTPSSIDITTFTAIETGLGRHLTWWISNRDRTIEISWKGPSGWDYKIKYIPDPDWASRLRELSRLS